jgi:hypothetical protein
MDGKRRQGWWLFWEVPRLQSNRDLLGPTAAARGWPHYSPGQPRDHRGAELRRMHSVDHGLLIFRGQISGSENDKNLTRVFVPTWTQCLR